MVFIMMIWRREPLAKDMENNEELYEGQSLPMTVLEDIPGRREDIDCTMS